MDAFLIARTTRIIPGDSETTPAVEEITETYSDLSRKTFTHGLMAWVPTREQAARKQEQEERDQADDRERAEIDAAYKSLTPREEQVYTLLDELIGACGDAGVDTSYFPHRAQMVLIEYAKKIAALEDL